MGHDEPPTAVRVAVAAWLVAIGAGLFETALVLATGTGGPDVVAGVVVRCLGFGAATVVVLRLRAGRRWARTTLAVALGVLGLLSLLVGPVRWLLDGHGAADVVDVLDAMSGTERLFALSRGLHVVAVVAAVVAMYLPSSGRYVAASSAGTVRPPAR